METKNQNNYEQDISDGRDSAEEYYREGIILIKKFEYEKAYKLIDKSAELGYEKAIKFQKKIGRSFNLSGVVFPFAVMFIIGLILFAYAYPGYRSYKLRGYNSVANSTIKNVYVSAQAYFEDHPEGKISLEILRDNGFNAAKNVNLNIVNPTRDKLLMETYHIRGDRTYTVKAIGSITF